METKDKEKVREAVRQRYGELAKAAGSASETSPASSCCGPAEASAQALPMASCCDHSHASAETSPAESCCGPADFSVEKMSALMGYSEEDIGSVPEGANMGVGCGNPVALASLRPGETVVDLGSGGGFDCFLAAREVGQTGRVIGVDMTPDMISQARRNAEKMETSQVEFRLGEIENLPVADNSADIIMSNCVINLSPDKPSVFGDAFRVLKPGGRLAISDVLATARLPEEVRNDLSLVGACIGGAATIEDTREMLEKAGFQDIRITPKDNSRELISQWDPKKTKKGLDYIVSAYIEAVKPS